MKRLKYCLIALAVIVALIVIVIKVNGLHFSKEDALHDIESKLHYGPSDEILYEHSNKDGSEFILAKCGNEGLSIAHLANHLGFLYGLGGEGEIGYKTCENQISVFYDMDHDRIYGMCYEPDIDQIRVNLSIGGKDETAYFTVDVDKNGFFFFLDAATINGLKTVDEHEDGEFAVSLYAESEDLLYERDFRINSNMVRGIVCDGRKLMDIEPKDFSFLMDAEDGPLSAEDINIINAGMKRITGIDFFATSGEKDCQSRKIELNFEPGLQSEEYIKLSLAENNGTFVPVISKKNMIAAAKGWMKFNYGKIYLVSDIKAKEIGSGEYISGGKDIELLLNCVTNPKNSNNLAYDGGVGSISVEVKVKANEKKPVKPWKLYYVDGITGDIRDIDELAINTEGGVTAEEMSEFNKMFEASVPDGNGSSTYTELSCFFTSYYSKPEDIDLAEFLRYCPLREEVNDDEEYQKIKTAADFGLPDSISELNTPTWRYKRSKVDALLKKYVDITTDDLTGKTDGRAELVYVESTDSYYNFTSDSGPGYFKVTYGEVDGDVYTLWNNQGNQLILRKTGDEIKILSHTISSSLYDYTVDELMARITPSRLYFVDAMYNMYTKTAASIMNVAAGKMVSKEEAESNKLDPDGKKFDTPTWHCEIVLIDYTEDSSVVIRDSVFPGTIDMYCNEYSDIVCVVVTDHQRNKKVEYYKDKNLYNLVRHWRDTEEKIGKQ